MPIKVNWSCMKYMKYPTHHMCRFLETTSGPASHRQQFASTVSPGVIEPRLEVITQELGGSERKSERCLHNSRTNPAFFMHATHTH